MEFEPEEPFERPSEIGKQSQNPLSLDATIARMNLNSLMSSLHSGPQGVVAGARGKCEEG